MSFELHHGDCLEIMAGLTGISAIVTDPPYGVDYRGNEWDNNIPNWLSVAMNVCNTVIFTTAIATLWEYPPANWIGCWHNIAGTSRSKLNGFNHWTPILFYGNPKFPIDTFETRMGTTVSENKKIDHPSPKPLRLMKWIVENSTEFGETVLDPFMGSGTTGVACLQTGRNFIGIEINKDYFKEASDRIKQEARQPLLFQEKSLLTTRGTDGLRPEQSGAVSQLPLLGNDGAG